MTEVWARSTFLVLSNPVCKPAMVDPPISLPIIINLILVQPGWEPWIDRYWRTKFSYLLQSHTATLSQPISLAYILVHIDSSLRCVQPLSVPSVWSRTALSSHVSAVHSVGWHLAGMLSRRWLLLQTSANFAGDSCQLTLLFQKRLHLSCIENVPCIFPKQFW